MKHKNGDKKENENFTRKYYDEKWDYIETKKGESYWRDKENHQTFETDTSLYGTFINDTIGDKSNKFDSDSDDKMWD